MDPDRYIAPSRVEFESIVECLRYRAEQQPAETAFWYTTGTQQDDRLSYEELERKARAVAVQLREAGATGKHVLLLYPPGLDYVAAFFGCLFAEAVAVPAYPPHRNRHAERIQAIYRDAEAECALTVQHVAAQLDDLGLGGLTAVTTDLLPTDQADDWKMPDVSANTLSVLQYTSGSTGVPKGVMLTHGNLLHNCGSIVHCFETSDTGVGLIWQPTFHDMGLVGGVLLPVFFGRPNVLMSPMAFLQSPIRWLEKITQYRVTVSGGPNFAYELCNEKITDDDCRGLDLSTWDVAFNGAEPIRPDTLEEFTRKFAPYGFRPEAHHPCYGMAETTLIINGAAKAAEPTIRAFDRAALESHQVLAAAGDDPAAVRLVGCGRAMPDMEIRIVDPESRKPLPESLIGEIWVSGPSVGQGYWNHPEETEHTFRATLDAETDAHYLRTGDLGFLHEGELFVSGRRKDVIIIRGRNLYPHDIERTVERAYGAQRASTCAVFAAGSDGDDRLVIVQEVGRHRRRENLDDILAMIREAVLEEYDVAADTVVMLKPGKLPKTSSGKVARNVCREHFHAGRLETMKEWSRTAGGRGVPATPAPVPTPASVDADAVQSWMVARIATQLGIDPSQVDVHQSFAHFGLDSATLVGVSGELQTWLGTPVSPTVLYNCPTIASLAGHLGAPHEPATQKTAVSVAGDARHLADSATGTAADPIAIVGLGCRFPHADSPDAFWSLLRNGVHAVSEMGSDRWDMEAYYSPDRDAPGKTYCRHAGLLDQIDQFDPLFFGIAPREAAGIDPQQRLLLEVSWEALENAGQSPDELAGDRVGVFVGISNAEYDRLQSRGANLEGIDAHTGTGSLNSVAAGRIAYFLGLRGPCMGVDTACSSSLLAVHLAARSLRDRECRAALAGGVNVILDPASMVAMCKLQALASDGCCKTFDEEADGYVRGEGCGMVLLKRLSDALADGDRVLGLIRGSAVNHDGRSNGLTAPHGPAQESVIWDALSDADIEPELVTYLETHGSATPLGDPIEVQAAAAVYASGRSKDSPLSIGSVKTNLGHLEAAAGIAGLLKVVLALKHGQIPPHLHLKKPNPYIPWDQLPITVPTQRADWPAVLGRRVAGISSFGLSGTNVHLIVEGVDEIASREADRERPRHLLTLSAADERALQALASRFGKALDDPRSPLPDLCFTANTGRAGLLHRIAIVAESVKQAQERLEAASEGRLSRGVVQGIYDGQRVPKIGFVFSGEASLHAGMGRQLFETQPTFRRELERCSEILQSDLQPSLLDVMYPRDDDPARWQEAAYGLPALFALEHALSELWKSWGVEPDVVLGQGIGEYAAACSAGVFRFEECLRLMAAYGRVAGQLTESGAFAPSGVDRLRAQFDELWQEIVLTKPSRPIVSAIDGRAVEEAIATRDYWREQLRTAGDAHELMDPLATLDIDLSLEIGPHPLLIGARHPTPSVAEKLALASLQQGRDDWSEMLQSLAQLIVRGVPVDWRGFDRDYARRKVPAPTYAFQRKRHWADTAASSREAASQQAREPASSEDLANWYYEIEWQPRTRLAQPLLRQASDRLPSPSQVAERVQPEVQRLVSQLDLPRYRELAPEMNKLAAGYARKALRTLGWQMAANEPVTVANVAPRLGIADRPRLLGQMLVILEEDGQLVRAAGGWRVRRQLPRRADPELMWSSLSRRLPECKAELSLMKHCGEQLAEVLRGQVDPLEVLFPDGSGELVESLYKDSPFARTLNTLVEETVAQTIEQLPSDRAMRILEIGGGTGSTTEQLLPRLPADRTEYLFTDVSEVFTHATAVKFRKYPFVRYGLLDIEVDPCEQGYAPHQFDLILAANVFHATRDLRETIRFSRQLLVPHGHLVLLEGTRPQYWLDLIFGLTEGWWRFVDTDLRPHHPMLSGRKWVDLLTQSGFDGAVALPEQDDRPASEQSPYAVVVAQADETRSPSQRPESESVSTKRGTFWLVLADQGGVGQHLGALLQERGDRCVLVSAGDHFDQRDDHSFLVRPSSRADLRRVLESLGAEDSSSLRSVVHLWSLDAPSASGLTVEGLASAQRAGCFSAAALVQEIQATVPSQLPSIWFVTRGAQAVGRNGSLGGLAQSPLWGFARVVAEESPASWGGLCDLDPEASDSDSAEHLLYELLQPDGEDQVAYRRDQRYAARLMRRPPATPGKPLHWRPDASYLISGGLGDLGLTVARWMARQGAKNLILFGRSDFPPRPEWNSVAGGDPQLAAKIAALEELEASGIRVRVDSADTADEDRLTRFVEDLRAEGWPPVRGVVHCAGVVEAGPLAELEEQQLERVFRPKVLGSWLLHRLLENERLDFFVTFSSGAALLSSPLLASYAAANAYLDALAHHRRDQGRPALSVNWGFWADVGMAARAQREIGQVFAPQGMDSFSPDQGMRALQQLLQDGAVQTAVMPVNWNEWCRSHPRASRSPLFVNLLQLETDGREATQMLMAAAHLSREEVLAAPEGERQGLVQGYLADQLAQVLRTPSGDLDVNLPLNYLGIDSLMAVELRNHIQADLDTTIPVANLLQRPTISQLASALVDQLQNAIDIPPLVPTMPHDNLRDVLQDVAPGPFREAAAAVLDRLDELSDEEVNTMLGEIMAKQRREGQESA